MRRLQMSPVSLGAGVNFEYPNMGRVILLGYGVEDKDSRFYPNSRFDVLPDGSFVVLQLKRIDLDFCYLHVLALHLLGSSSSAYGRGEDRHPNKQKVPGVHVILLRVFT